MISSVQNQGLMDASAPLGPALWLPKLKHGFPLNGVSTSRLRALASGTGVNAAAATRAELLESAHKRDVQGAALEWSCKALRVPSLSFFHHTARVQSPLTQYVDVYTASFPFVEVMCSMFLCCAGSSSHTA